MKGYNNRFRSENMKWTRTGGGGGSGPVTAGRLPAVKELKLKTQFPNIYNQLRKRTGEDFDGGELLMSIKRLSEVVDLSDVPDEKAASCCRLVVEKDLTGDILRLLKIVFECSLESVTKNGVSVICLDDEIIMKGKVEKEFNPHEKEILEDVIGPKTEVEDLFPQHRDYEPDDIYVPPSNITFTLDESSVDYGTNMVTAFEDMADVNSEIEVEWTD